MLRSVAAALGVSETQVHKDLSSANYSSIRAGLVEAEKTFAAAARSSPEHRDAGLRLPGCTRQMERGELPLPRNAPEFLEARTAYSRCRWLGPAAGWVDPVAERQGVVLGLDAALSTLEDECARQGLDYEEVLDQRAYELEMMRDLKIPPPQWMGEKVTATEAIQKPQVPA
jgi:capsid protein